MVAVQEITNVH